MSKAFQKVLNEKQDTALNKVIEQIPDLLQGIDWFLAHGSLLGCWRHGGIIPWDDDFDIFVQDTQKDNIVEVLRKSGWSYTPRSYRRNNHAISKLCAINESTRIDFFQIWHDDIKLHNRSDGTGWPYFDIFFYKEHHDLIGFEYNYGNDFHWILKEHIFPLKQDKFNKFILPIPNKPNLILDIKFPNWHSECISPIQKHLDGTFLETTERISASEISKIFTMKNILYSIPVS